MQLAFAIVFTLFFLIISYPYIKNLQLCGYDISFVFKHSLFLPYRFGGKNRLVFTKRVVRLIILFSLLLATVNLLIFLLIQIFWIPLICMLIEFFFFFYILLFCALILIFFEQLIKKVYINRAIKILNNFNGIKIAITGSFGKSSTKNFLTEILKSKYQVCSSPKNFNTPMGLCKTAIEYLSKDDEILVVEMGARRNGDIAELMNMLKPTYGILTAIGEQHLETFECLENVKKTKFELCENMRNGGIVVFDCSNENTKELFDKYRGEKRMCGCDGGFAFIDNLSVTAKGSCFILHLGKRQVKVNTKIVGRLLLCDILVASAMAYILGVDEKTIAKVIANLQPYPHRLQMIETPICTIVDDSYNSNFLGAQQAVEVVNLFTGIKIIITPGFVEQGARQYELNYKFGKMIACTFDHLIIMNQTNLTALSRGAKIAGMKESQIHYAKTRKEQNEILQNLQKKGSVVLFENDLPDNFV